MEIFKDIPWYEWLYQVSNIWNVKSIKSWRWLNYRIMNTQENNWYLVVWLKINWVRKACKVHRLVALTFIENTKNKPQINHIDWNRKNNTVDNLEWVTNWENVKHSYSFLSRKTTSYWKWKNRDLYWKKKPILQLSKDWFFIKEWWSAEDAKNILWVGTSNISECCNWKRKSAWWYLWKFKS